MGKSWKFDWFMQQTSLGLQYYYMYCSTNTIGWWAAANHIQQYISDYADILSSDIKKLQKWKKKPVYK